MEALFGKFDDLNLPVRSDYDLDHLECQLAIDDNFKTMFVNTLKSQMKFGGRNLPITDQLTKIMPKELWITYNWNGKHSKKKLCVYEEIFTNSFNGELCRRFTFCFKS